MVASVDVNIVAEPHAISSGVPQVSGANVDSSEESDYSEDEDGGLQSLYSTVPEDLGFTLLGLDFPENDLRIMRRLRLDLDTFMTLSESELVEIGIKESINIKRQITKNIQGNQIFNRPKKSLKLTRDEMKILGSSLTGQISELNLLLANINADVNMKKPANFREYEGFSSLEIFQAACTTLLKQAKETRKCLESLSQTVGIAVPGDDSKEKEKMKNVRRKKIAKKSILFTAGCLCIYFAVRNLILPSISLRK